MTKYILLLLCCLMPLTVYAQDKEDVVERTYYSGDVLREEVSMKNGQRHGAYKMFDQTGELLMEKNYENGVSRGVVKTYHPNGQLSSEGYAENGAYDGLLKRYDEQGRVKRETFYQKGMQEGLDIFYRNGNVYFMVRFVDSRLDDQITPPPQIMAEITRAQETRMKGGVEADEIFYKKMHLLFDSKKSAEQRRRMPNKGEVAP